MDRIKKLCSYLNACNSFADVACDHGYCAQYMLKNGLCKSAVISDISEKSLNKAKTLLTEYINGGVCRAVCCDGLEEIDCDTDQILIAGIGGEEIINILKKSFIPKTFVFQPMKNAEALRKYLLENNCNFLVDDVFTDDKNYYFIIKGRVGCASQSYSKAQMLYGRDSLKNPVFKDYLREEISKKQTYLKREMSEENRNILKAEVAFMEGVLSGEIN